jgi:hypothetical protein
MTLIGLPVCDHAGSPSTAMEIEKMTGSKAATATTGRNLQRGALIESNAERTK